MLYLLSPWLLSWPLVTWSTFHTCTTRWCPRLVDLWLAQAQLELPMSQAWKLAQVRVQRIVATWKECSQSECYVSRLAFNVISRHCSKLLYITLLSPMQKSPHTALLSAWLWISKRLLGALTVGKRPSTIELVLRRPHHTCLSRIPFPNHLLLQCSWGKGYSSHHFCNEPAHGPHWWPRRSPKACKQGSCGELRDPDAILSVSPSRPAFLQFKAASWHMLALGRKKQYSWGPFIIVYSLDYRWMEQT